MAAAILGMSLVVVHIYVKKKIYIYIYMKGKNTEKMTTGVKNDNFRFYNYAAPILTE